MEEKRNRGDRRCRRKWRKRTKRGRGDGDKRWRGRRRRRRRRRKKRRKGSRNEWTKRRKMWMRAK